MHESAIPPLFLILPAFNEEECVPLVMGELFSKNSFASGVTHAERFIEIILVDNASTDRTAEIAASFGIRVLSELERGYGAACLKGIEHIFSTQSKETLDEAIIFFLDADYSDYPEDIWRVLAGICDSESDLCIGSRLALLESKFAVPPIARFGNRFACFWIKLLYGKEFTDLGPMRAIRARALERIGVQDRTWGWTLEMQLKACQFGLVTNEVPVRYRERGAGKSKISQSIPGATRAAIKILYVLGKHILGRFI